MSEEHVEVSSSSEPEIEELLERDKELEQDLQKILGSGMARPRVGGIQQTAIEDYLQRPDGHKRAKERVSSGVEASSSGRVLDAESARVPQVVLTGKWRRRGNLGGGAREEYDGEGDPEISEGLDYPFNRYAAPSRGG